MEAMKLIRGLSEEEKFKVIRPMLGEHILGEYGMPIIHKTDEEKLDIENMEPVGIKNLTTRQDNSKKIVLPFVYDKDLLKYWNDPMKYIPKLQTAMAVGTPDYSIYPTMNINEVRHYRVDKLDNIKLSNIPRAGKSQFRIFNANTYVSRRMGMFSGKEQVITVRIPDTLVGPFIDQFGKRITISEYTEGMLLVTFNAVASVILLGWLLGLQYVEVLEPQSVRNAMTDLIKQNMEIYSKKN